MKLLTKFMVTLLTDGNIHTVQTLGGSKKGRSLALERRHINTTTKTRIGYGDFSGMEVKKKVRR